MALTSNLIEIMGRVDRLKLVGAAILSETTNFQINYSVWNLHFAAQKGSSVCYIAIIAIWKSVCHIAMSVTIL